MGKVLVIKERLENIAKFISTGDCCYGCPLYGKCQRYSDEKGCKEAILAYLSGGDFPVTKDVKLELINCNTCWYYQEHKGKVDCLPYDNAGTCLQNLCDR